MIIANPIYDVVFKYLMEDLDIAKGFIARLINENIVEITFQPQEISVRKAFKDEIIRLVRMDFKAVIQLENGEKKMVLIELQKASKLLDIMRFRTYLAENYKKGEDKTNALGEVVTHPLAITTIYFLGFPLNEAHLPVVKVDRVLRDLINDTILPDNIKEPFIEYLTHDSIVVQIPFLNPKTQSSLERLLNIFNQDFKLKDDKHKLKVDDDDIEDPLIKKLIRRLNKAVESEEILAEMAAEDEVNRVLGDIERELEHVKSVLGLERQKVEETQLELEAERQKAEETQLELEAERQKAEAERQKAEAERQKAEEKEAQMEVLRQELAALKKQMNK